MEYRGYIIFKNRFEWYYIESYKVNFEYEFKQGFLFDIKTQTNRRSVKMELFESTETQLKKCIDMVIDMKDAIEPKTIQTQLLDLYFNELKLSAPEFKKTFEEHKYDFYSQRYRDKAILKERLLDYAKKCQPMLDFLTDDKIDQLYKDQYEIVKVRAIKKGDLNSLAMWLEN